MKHCFALGLISTTMLLLAACDQQAPSVTKSETSAPVFLAREITLYRRDTLTLG